MKPSISGVGVLDKTVAVLSALETAPRTLTELVEATGLTRATAHRLATAMETHGLVRRDADGRFALGARTLALGRAAERAWPLSEAAGPVLAELRDATGESAQLWIRQGDRRICVASRESPHGLRTIVSTGSTLPLEQGSGGRALCGPAEAGWVASVAEREAGVASVSAPVIDGKGLVVAAIGVSGPIERLSRDPGPRYGPSVVDAAARVAKVSGLS